MAQFLNNLRASIQRRCQCVQLWTWKFVIFLTITVAFLVLALPISRNPETGEATPLLPKQTGSGPASFVFLLSLLYVLSHLGGCALAFFRGPSEGEDDARGKKKGKPKTKR